MKLSNQILTGAALAMTAFCLDSLQGYLRIRHKADINSKIQVLGDVNQNIPPPSVDSLLFTALPGASFVSGVLWGLAILFCLNAIYQTAKSAEKLLASKNIQAP